MLKLIAKAGVIFAAGVFLSGCYSKSCDTGCPNSEKYTPKVAMNSAPAKAADTSAKPADAAAKPAS
ncbi:MAG TPA: hypothetical protein VL360_07255 [Gammaproteobacteria bacterium]|jgi:hypothetical protein|nr:hypothetical protein [Gammaproteobacteria bacterium]